MFEWISIYIDGIFGGTIPEKVDQDLRIGDNDLEEAKAAKIMFLLDTGDAGVTNLWAKEWEKMLEREVKKYSDENEFIRFEIFTIGGLIDVFEADFFGDAILLL